MDIGWNRSLVGLTRSPMWILCLIVYPKNSFENIGIPYTGIKRIPQSIYRALLEAILAYFHFGSVLERLGGSQWVLSVYIYIYNYTSPSDMVQESFAALPRNSSSPVRGRMHSSPRFFGTQLLQALPNTTPTTPWLRWSTDVVYSGSMESSDWCDESRRMREVSPQRFLWIQPPSATLLASHQSVFRPGTADPRWEARAGIGQLRSQRTTR